MNAEKKETVVSNDSITLAAVTSAVTAGAIAAIGVIWDRMSDPENLKDLDKDSLIEYTKLTRVEPLVLFDESLRLQPYIPDVFQSLVNIFSGYYLQAVAITCNVGNVEVKKLLGKLNPNRQIDNSEKAALASDFVEIVKGKMPSKESFDNKLTQRYLEGICSHISKEEITDEEEEAEKRADWIRKSQRSQRETKEEKRRKKKHKWDKKEEKRRSQRELREQEIHNRTSIGIGRNSIDELNTNVNLSAGKTISVEIENNGSRATIPVNVRLIVKEVNPNALVNFLTVIKSDRSVIARFKKWRSGEIEFFKDLVLCQDIIDEEKNAHFTDKEGIFRNLRARNRGKSSKLIDLAMGDVNVATASSIIVMSKETAKKVEVELGGKLDNYRARENLFKLTFTMIMVVIDTQWDKVVIYHRSIDEPSILSVKDFKTRGRDTGPDINEILMAYRAGSAPTF